MEDCIFYAELLFGFPLKINFEILKSLNIPRANLYFTNEGITIFECDVDNSNVNSNITPSPKIICEIKYEREKFVQYFCNEQKTLNINVKDMTLATKGIKKKDTVILYCQTPKIRKDKIIKFNMHIISDNSKSKIEKRIIKCNDVDDEPKIRSPCYKSYNYPKSLASSKCIRLKSFFMENKKQLIKVTLQTSYFISFCAINENQEEETEHICGEIVSSKMLNYPKWFSQEKHNNYNGLYTSIYQSQDLNIITKLTSLSKQINIYAPFDIENCPLKIVTDNGGLGYITLYIKTLEQINLSKKTKKSKK